MFEGCHGDLTIKCLQPKDKRAVKELFSFICKVKNTIIVISNTNVYFHKHPVGKIAKKTV